MARRMSVYTFLGHFENDAPANELTHTHTHPWSRSIFHLQTHETFYGQIVFVPPNYGLENLALLHFDLIKFISSTVLLNGHRYLVWCEYVCGEVVWWDGGCYFFPENAKDRTFNKCTKFTLTWLNGLTFILRTRTHSRVRSAPSIEPHERHSTWPK